MKKETEKNRKIEDLISELKKYYEFPNIKYKEKISKNFFYHVKKKKYFIIIALFDKQNRILLLRDFSKNYGWELIGSACPKSKIYDLNDAVQVVAQKIIGTKVYDIEPTATLTNKFICGKEEIIHQGISFIARAINPPDIPKNLEWTFAKSLPKTMFTTNLKIAKQSLKTIKHRKYIPPASEVTSSENLGWRKTIHKKIINPPFDKFSSEKLKKRTLKKIDAKTESIIDIASGDDEFIFDIIENRPIKTAVCNDISVKSLKFLKKETKERSPVKIFFTNHNILEMPLNTSFDLVLCKNVIHHLKNDKEIIILLKQLKKLSNRQIVIVDVEDPKKSTIMARLWNRYYKKFLHDQGKNFLTKNKLNKLLEKVFNKKQFSIDSVSTIKGNYLLVKINN